MTAGIYRIRNRLNGHSYIGSSIGIEGRWNVHKAKLNAGKHHSKRLQSAWVRDGADWFSLEVIEEVTDYSQLTVREQHWIDDERKQHPIYNMRLRAESCLGYRHTPEARLNMSIAQKKVKNRKPMPPEARRRQAETIRGRKHSPERVEKARSAMLASLPTRGNTKRGWTPEQRAEVGERMRNRTRTTLGKKRSEETKRKISESRKRMLAAGLSQETKRRISEAKRQNPSGGVRGKGHSDATKKLLSNLLRGVKRGPRKQETREKISKALKGRVFSIESRRKMSEAQQRLRNCGSIKS